MEEINLKDLWYYFKNYLLLIIACAIVGGSIGYSYNTYIKKPLYSTYTTIILVRNNENSIKTSDLSQDITLNQKLVSTYTEIIKSRLVLGQVIDSLDLNISYGELAKKISVHSLNDTEMLKIVVTDEDATEAVIIANNLTEVFGKEVSEIYKLDNVFVVDVAKVDEKPVNISTVRDTIIGALLGIFLSSLIVFIKYYFNDKIRDSESIEKELEVPVLAKVFKSSDATQLVVKDKPNAITSECIRNLRTNLQFSSIDKNLKTVLVTSSVPGDGKSFVSSNLAISFAQNGKRVLLVDCDLRKGVLHKRFGVSGFQGLSNLLLEDINNFKKYVVNTDVENLSLIPRGVIPPNPSELLGSKKNSSLMKVLRDRYDIIILDSPPVTGLSDALILSPLVDKVILVSSMNHTPMPDLINAKKSLDGAGAELAGTVLNNVTGKGKSSGGYYYYYSDDKEKEKEKRELEKSLNQKKETKKEEVKPEEDNKETKKAEDKEGK